MLGSSIGLLFAAISQWRWAALFGGAICGLGISSMHYLGMLAYRVQGLVDWNTHYILVSVLLATSLSALCFHRAQQRTNHAWYQHPALILSLAIVSLHFVGMAGFSVSPALVTHDLSNPPAMQALAFSVAGVTLLILGAGLSSYLIDDSVRLDSIKRLRYLALNDSLTGLPNRASFQQHLDQELARIHMTEEQLALVFIDLDGFKEVNDLHGHSTGDDVLRAWATPRHIAR